tara:strand:- start:410 stop:574 length:165 start_codon:yes stop_codon:yes gene_type:complete
MSKNELIDLISEQLFREKGKVGSRKSYLKIRNYLYQLDQEELKSMLNDFKDSSI